MTQTHQTQAQRAALPKGAGLKPSLTTNIRRPGRIVAGLGRRGQATKPIMHDDAHPSPVHRPAQPVNMAQIRALQAGQPWPPASSRPLDLAPAHAADTAATLTKPDSTKLG